MSSSYHVSVAGRVFRQVDRFVAAVSRMSLKRIRSIDRWAGRVVWRRFVRVFEPHAIVRSPGLKHAPDGLKKDCRLKCDRFRRPVFAKEVRFKIGDRLFVDSSIGIVSANLVRRGNPGSSALRERP